MMRIYLVGGAVRDLLLGRPHSDRDFLVVDGSEAELLAIHPRARRVGKAFPVYKLAGAEFTLCRECDIHADLLQRDLTINALALEVFGQEDSGQGGPEQGASGHEAGLAAGRLVLHPLAPTDLRDKILRPGSPESMRLDPLRAIRAARFAAVFPDFAVHPSLAEAMRETADLGRLGEPAPERVGQEVMKAMAAPRPGRFLELLAEMGCLSPWFAELEEAARIPAGPPPYHPENLLEHVCQVMDRLAGSPLRVWMGLCHDLGKTLTPRDAWPRHHAHDALGANLAVAVGERLRLPTRFIRAGALASSAHMIAGRYPELRPGTRTDLLDRLWRENVVEELFALTMADWGDESMRVDDFRDLVRSDLEAVLAVRLPPEARDLGPASGEKLRLLRAQTLAERRPPRRRHSKR